MSRRALRAELERWAALLQRDLDRQAGITLVRQFMAWVERHQLVPVLGVDAGTVALTDGDRPQDAREWGAKAWKALTGGDRRGVAGG